MDAGKTYLSALKIFTAVYGEYHVSVARALDKLGMATTRTRENLDLALEALEDALTIRCKLLGMDHVDSIDTLNNIAGVRLHRHEYVKAVQDYRAVLDRRTIIFGSSHPSCAVAAFAIGWILDTHLQQKEESRIYYKFALSICRQNGMEHSSQAREIMKQLANHRPNSASQFPDPEVIFRKDLVTANQRSGRAASPQNKLHLREQNLKRPRVRSKITRFEI